MKNLSYLLLIALGISGISACQKKSYTCQCKLPFNPDEQNLILKAKNKRNANAACLYLNPKTQGNDLDGYYDCHLVN